MHGAKVRVAVEAHADERRVAGRGRRGLQHAAPLEGAARGGEDVAQRRDVAVEAARALNERDGARGGRVADEHVGGGRGARGRAAVRLELVEQRAQRRCLLYTSPSPRDS